MNILNLPQDITLQVFSFLSPTDLAGGVRRTCKTWNNLSYDRSLWKNISLSKFDLHNKFCTSTFLDFLNGICEYVHSLDLGRANLDSEGYMHENILCSNLKEINLFGSDISGECIITLLQKYKTLSSISLSLRLQSTRIFLGIVKQLCELDHLESLSVHNCSIDEHLQDLLSEFCEIFKTHSMKTLSFVHCDLPNDVYREIIQHNPDVCELNIVLCGQIYKNIFEVSTGLKQIRKVNLADTKCDDSVLISLSNRSPYLRYLSISSCGSFVTDTGISYLAEHCPFITTLIISRSRYDKSSITNAGLEAIADCCKHLCELVVNYCSEISDMGVTAVAQGCAELQDFEIAGCTALSDAAILCLVEKCPRLQKLKLTECVQLTSFSINAVITKLRHLKYLNLETCHRIANIHLIKKKVSSDVSVGNPVEKTIDPCETRKTFRTIKEPEASSQKGELKINTAGDKSDHEIERGQLDLHSHVFNLHLGFCSKISNNCIREVARFCPDLRGLTLQGCTFLTDSAVEVLVKSCRALTKLDISGGSVNQTSKLTDRSLLFIADNCETMMHLVICKNPNITTNGLFEVIMRCPKIRVVSVSVGDRTNVGIPSLTARFSQVESKLIRIERFGGARVDIHIYLNKGDVKNKTPCLVVGNC